MKSDKAGYLSFTNNQFDWIVRMSGQLSKREMAVLLAIIRYTYGFNRKEARLSGSYLEGATGILARHIPGTLKKLIAREIITVLPRAAKNTNTIRFDWSEVMVVGTPKLGGAEEQDTPKSGVSIPPNREEDTSQNGRKIPPKLGEKTIKNTIQKYNTEETGEVVADTEEDDEFNPFM